MRIHASELGVRSYPPFSVVLRAPGAGLGDLGDTATTALATANINRDFNSYVGNLAYAVEQGQVVSPEMMAAGLKDRVTEVCTSTLTGDPACDPNAFNAQISQLASQYAAALAAQQQKTAALVAAGQISVPSGYYGGQNLYDPNYAPPAPASYSSPAPSYSTAPANASVQVTNTSRPGQSFKVGDSFTVSVTGPANQQVSVHGVQNGQDKGTTPLGNTDASGRFNLNGTMTADTVGNWTETWTVGNTAAPQVSFSVAAAAAPAPSSSGGGSTPAPSSSGSSSTVPAVLTAPSSSGSSSTPAPSSTGFDLSSIMTKLQAPSPVMGLPWLAVILIGGAGLWWFSQRGRR